MHGVKKDVRLGFRVYVNKNHTLVALAAVSMRTLYVSYASHWVLILWVGIIIILL